MKKDILDKYQSNKNWSSYINIKQTEFEAKKIVKEI